MKWIFSPLLLLLGIGWIMMKPLAVQASPIDSLEAVLSTQTHTDRISTLDALIQAYLPLDLQQALAYAEETLALSKKRSYPEGLMIARGWLGEIYKRKGDFETALHQFYQQLELYQSWGDSTGMANAYQSMARIYRMVGNYPLALKFLLNTLEIQQRLQLNTANTFRDIAEFYFRLGESEQSIHYYEQAVAMAGIRQVSEKEDQTYLRFNYYRLQGRMLTIKHQYSLALVYLDSALYLASEVGGALYRAKIHDLKAFTLKEMQRYEEALILMDSSLSIRQNRPERLDLLPGHKLAADICIAAHKWTQAIDHAQQVLDLASDYKSYRKKVEACANLHLAHQALGNYQEAYRYHLAYTQYRDSLINQAKNLQILSLQMDFDVQQKEQENTALSLANQLKEKTIRNQFYLILLSVLVLLLVCYQAIRYYWNQKKSRIEFQLLYQQAHDGVAIFRGNTFEHCNDQFAAIWGVERQSLIGNTLSEIAAREPFYSIFANTGWEQEVEDVYLSGAGVMNRSGKKADGSPMHLEINLSRLPGKKPASLLVFLKDVTDQKEAEAAVVQELQQKNALINNTTDLIWSIDQELLLRSANDAFLNTVEQNIGRKLSLGDSILSAEYDPDFAALWRSYYQRALAGEIVKSTDETEFQGLRSYYEISLHPIYAQQQIVGVSCFSKDVTEKTLALLALQESEYMSRQHLERMPASYIAFDHEWRFTYVNTKAAKLWKMEPEELLGKVFWELFPDAVGGPFYEALHQAKKSQQFVYNEEYVPNWDTWLADFIYPDKMGIAVFFHDITQLKKSESQLAQELREKNALINSTDDLIWSVDPDMKLRSFNQPFAQTIASITGRPPQVGAQVLMPEFGEELFEKWETYYSQALLGESFGATECIEIQGQLLYSETAFHPIMEGEELIGVSCFAKNVTEKKLATIALEESEQKYRLHLERMPAAYVAYDHEWRFTYANQKAANIWGKKPEELIGKIVWEVFPEAVGGPFYQRLHKARETEQFIYTEEYVAKMDTWFADFIYPDQTGIAVFFHDISEAKKAEIALKDQESLLARVYNAANDSMGLIAITEEGKFVHDQTNRAAEEIFGNFGLNLPDYEGLEATYIFQKFLKRSPEEAQILESQLKAVMESRKSIMLHKRYEFGEDVVLYASATLNPIINSAGQCTHLLWVMRDVTQEKAQERAITESQARLQLIYNSATEMMCLLRCGTEQQCYIESANQAFLQMVHETHPDLSLDELEGSELDDILPETNLINNSATYADLLANMHQAAEQGSPITLDLSKIVNDKVHTYEVSVNPILNERDTPSQLLMVIHDQTEKLYEAERTFIEITKAVETDRSRIARELHDNLTQLLGVACINLKNLSYDLTDLQKQTKYQQALHFLEESIDESRSIAHRLMPKAIQDFGLIPSIQELIEHTQPFHEVAIRFKHNPIPRLEQETELNLFRIVQQGLANALQHAQARKIEIRLTQVENSLRLQIQDDGVGFAVGRRGHTNSGIGLRTMRSRAIQLGGLMEIKSQPRQGTLLSIEVPMKLEAVAQELEDSLK